MMTFIVWWAVGYLDKSVFLKNAEKYSRGIWDQATRHEQKCAPTPPPCTQKKKHLSLQMDHCKIGDDLEEMSEKSQEWGHI